MVMSIFEVAGEVYTRFRVSIKQYPAFKKLLDKYGITECIKKSSRFIYFEAKGDYLNGRS